MTYLSPEAIDRIFPYVCFAYGALMSFALNVPALGRIAEAKLPTAANERWRAHRGLAYLCLVIGAFWILQNLWLT